MTIGRLILTCGPLLSVALSGCAIDRLRLDYAGDVAGKGRIAAAASREFLGQVDQSRTAANIDLMALDPACGPGPAFVRLQPQLGAVNPAKPPRGWLCFQQTKGVTYDNPVSLAPLRRDLEPTFLLIDALGAYSAAITAILEDKAADPVADFKDALALAHSAGALLGALAGDGTTVVPAADDPRVTAVDGFIQFVARLAHEHEQAERLKTLADSAGSATTIKALRGHLDIWELSRKGDEGLRLVIAGTLLRQAQAFDPPLSSTLRRDFAKAYYERGAANAAAGALKAALDATLAELDAADADLRRVLKDKPQLTDKERRKLAAITRERVGEALDSLAKVALALAKGV